MSPEADILSHHQVPPDVRGRRLAILLRARSLRNEGLDRPGHHERAIPDKAACLGIGAWYNLPVALFGGTAPLVIQWLGGIGHSSWFSWYVSIGAVVAFITTLSLPETKGVVLR